jgi:hypothetical protein
MSGTLSVGQLIVFISYLAQLYVPVNQLTQSWGLIASAGISARRVFEILETEADLQDGPLTLSQKGARGTIEWRGVSFCYRSEMPVLRSIDLRVESGMKVAVVGPTGAGKSTMLPRHGPTFEWDTRDALTRACGGLATEQPVFDRLALPLAAGSAKHAHIQLRNACLLDYLVVQSKNSPGKRCTRGP